MARKLVKGKLVGVPADDEKDYRAVKWKQPGADVTVVGPWRRTRLEAERDAVEDFAPHRRAHYGTQNRLNPAGHPPLEFGEIFYERAEAYYRRSQGTR